MSEKHCPTTGSPCAMQETIESIAADTKLIKELLTGNGDPSKGMIVRMDRLEQREESRSKLVSIAIGVSGTAILTALWAGIKQLLKS